MELELHLFGVTDKRELWHTIGHGAGRWDELGDVDRQVKAAGTVGTDRTIVDAACTTDSIGNFHALVLADNGGLWYTVRAALDQPGPPEHKAGSWLPLEDLRQPQKPAANIRKIDAVGAVTDGMTLFVLVATEDQKLQRAIRKPDGPDIFKGKWTEPFKQIKPGGVFPRPLTAPFTVLVGAHFKKP
jgi:hypothetical protein